MYFIHQNSGKVLADLEFLNQLAVVIAALIQRKSPLALGNVVGSSISNILGAFSLGLFFHPGPLEFDRSSKIYTTVLLLVTTAVMCLMLLGTLNKIAGGVLVALFAIYLSSIAVVIYKGILAAPEDSDDDSDDSSHEGDSDNEADSPSASYVTSREQTQQVLSETSALLAENRTASGPVSRGKRLHSVAFHIAQLFAGFLALSISGYVLSHSASAIAKAVNLSGTVLGITVLSFATTLPEKFVAVVSGSRGHGGIVVANTAGSNIFLLTLCLGVVALSGDEESHKSTVVPFELAVLWFSSAIFFLIVLLGSRRWVGAVLVVLYVAFLILEFTAFRR